MTIKNMTVYRIATGAASLILPIFASAAKLTAPAPMTSFDGTIGDGSVYGTVCIVIDWIFTAAVIATIIFVLVAAFKYMNSKGDDKETTAARKTLQYAAVGIAIAILAKGLPQVVGSVFGQDSGLGVC